MIDNKERMYRVYFKNGHQIETEPDAQGLFPDKNDDDESTPRRNEG